VGATSFGTCKRALTDRGVYLPLNTGLRELLQVFLTAFGGGKKVKFGISTHTRQALESNLAMIEAGVLVPVVDHAFPMARIADAHRRVEGRHKRGTVVITMAA